MRPRSPARVSPIPPVVPAQRVGDVAAMLRVMQPLNGTTLNAANRRRRLLADLFRFIGINDVGSLPPETIAPTTDLASSVVPHGPPVPAAPDHAGLSPRLEQTLQCLLDGDSEKQVARKLSLSQHTVHVYVKALYRRFGVSSRGELLARHFKR